MHSLYWRIFLAFWVALTLILVGTVTVAVNATAHRTDRPWVQRGQMYAQAARAFETGGPEALRTWLESLGGEPFSRTFVVGPSGKEMLGRPLPQFLSGTPEGPALHSAGTAGAIAPIGGALVLVGADGSSWHVVVGPVRDSPRLFGELELPGVPSSILVIALRGECRAVLLPCPLPRSSGRSAAPRDTVDGGRGSQRSRPAAAQGPAG